MQIALISICKQADFDAQPRALLSVANGTIGQYQIHQAIEAGAEKIIACIDTLSGPVSKLQSYAEGRGVLFVIIRKATEISEHVAASDDIMLIGDGIYAEPDLISQIWNNDAGTIGVVSADISRDAAEHFERIDINHLWAGLAKLKGQDLLGLRDLPDDWSIESAALRSAVQNGYNRTVITDESVENGNLTVSTTSEDARKIEAHILSSLKGDDANILHSMSFPYFQAVMANELWKNADSCSYLNLASYVLPPIALLAGYFLHPFLGFVFLCLALFTIYLGNTLFSIFERPESSWAESAVFGVAAIALNYIAILHEDSSLSFYISLYVSLTSICIYYIYSLIRIAANMAWESALRDPVLLLLVLAFASILGIFILAIVIISLVLMILYISNIGSGRDIQV